MALLITNRYLSAKSQPFSIIVIGALLTSGGQNQFISKVYQAVDAVVDLGGLFYKYSFDFSKNNVGIEPRDIFWAHFYQIRD